MERHSPSKLERVKEALVFAGPAIFTSICRYSLGVITQAFAGHIFLRFSPLLSTFSLECNGIRGSIPQQMGNLTELTELYLGGNSLNETIPSAIAKLPNLALLNLSRNQSEDSIPMDLGKMKSLEFISLYNNSLSRTIPESLVSLEHLRWLDLGINKMNGSIPPQLGIGMDSVLETLCGQAFGAKQFGMLGVYMQRSWIILFTTAFFLSPIYVWAVPILKLIGQEDEISDLAGNFAVWMLSQLFAHG